MIYLDNNATTLIDAEVADTIHALMQMRLANPSSQHASGRQARNLLEDAKESILRNIDARTEGMSSDSIIITSGGTEANNLAVFGFGAQRPGTIIVSSIEHPSTLAAAQLLESKGRQVRYLPCDKTGLVRLDVLDSWLRDDIAPTSFVSLMMANNETGVIQPVVEASALCRAYKVLFHTDAVQALGKLPVEFAKLEVDAMTLCAHKIHGPVGVGGLVLRNGVSLTPQLLGGFQQGGLRPGTEMVALTCGLAKAIELAQSDRLVRVKSMEKVRDHLEARLVDRIPNATIIGPTVARLPNTCCVAFPGVDRQALQLGLDQLGIACGTGSACASGSSQPSHVLQAMQLPPEIINGAIRLSLSFESTIDEAEAAVTAIETVVARICT